AYFLRIGPGCSPFWRHVGELIGLLDQRRPFFKFGIDKLVEGLRRTLLRRWNVQAYWIHPLHDDIIGERFLERGIYLFDNWLRCAFWKKESVPCVYAQVSLPSSSLRRH